MSQPDLTRREMYDLVWSIPTVRVAESFGLSEEIAGSGGTVKSEGLKTLLRTSPMGSLPI
jgi:hypothetical protein